MAFNFRYTRYSAFCQVLLGGLCVIFGIADRATMFTSEAFHTQGVIAIWMGAWFFITGIIGFFASQHVPNSTRPKTHLVSTYLGFSVVAIVFAGVILICYGIGIAIIQYNSTSERICTSEPTYHCRYITVYYNSDKRHTSVGLAAMILIFAVAEFGVGIWASICCCMGYNGCCCDTSSPQTPGQIVYLQAQQGGPIQTYVMTQGPNGMPVAVPAVTSGHGPVHPVPNQVVGGQGYMVQSPPTGVPAGTPMQQVQGFPTSVAQQPIVTTQYAANAPTGDYKV